MASVRIDWSNSTLTHCKVENLDYPGIWKTLGWASGSPSLQVTAITQPATDEELKMIFCRVSESVSATWEIAPVQWLNKSLNVSSQS